jgi:hypothetical protein
MVLATIALVGVGYLQVMILTNTDTAQRIEKRAWLGIDAITFQPRVAPGSGESLPPWPTYDDGKVRFRLRVVLRNVGQTPAFEIRVAARIYLETGDQNAWKAPQKKVCDDLRAKLLDKNEEPSPYTIVAKDLSFPYNVDLEIPRPPDHAYHPVIVGCVAYRTALDDKPHQTPFFGRISVTDSRRPVDPQDTPHSIKLRDRAPSKNGRLAVIHLGVAGKAD